MRAGGANAPPFSRETSDAQTLRHSAQTRRAKDPRAKAQDLRAKAQEPRFLRLQSQRDLSSLSQPATEGEGTAEEDLGSNPADSAAAPLNGTTNGTHNNATADVFRPFLLRKKHKQATTKPRAKNMLSCSTAIELLILRFESRIVGTSMGASR